MIDHASVTKWLHDYIAAWTSSDPAAIGELFGANATYRYSPYDEPVRGRDAIVSDWLDSPDAPGSFQADYRPIAVDGHTAVANGRTLYFEPDGKTITRQFDNIFVLQFDDQGRCVDFCEWYMQPRGS